MVSHSQITDVCQYARSDDYNVNKETADLIETYRKGFEKRYGALVKDINPLSL